MFPLRGHSRIINPLNAELIPVCYLLALLGAHHFLHVSRIRVKLLTIRLLMSYIYDISNLRVNSALNGGEWLVPRPSHFHPWGMSPGTHQIRGWVGPTDLNTGEKTVLSIFKTEPSLIKCSFLYENPRQFSQSSG